MKIKRITEMEVEQNQLMVGDRITIADAEWRVLDIQDGKALIWKSTKITDHVFNEDGSNVYEGSDIQRYLQEDFPETMPVDIMEDVTEEGFFLLTVEQIRKYMPKELDRIATDEDDRTTWYWTASPSVGLGSYVRGVGTVGSVGGNSAYNSTGVAPACWLINNLE